MIIIFDLDGTLSDSSHRDHFLLEKPKNWDAWNAACGADPPIRPMCMLAAGLAAYHYVAIWSGRSEAHLAETVAWLKRAGVNYDELRLRPVDDRRGANELKGEWLGQLRKEWGPPTFAVDDRASCVAWWRAQGITCLDAAGHPY